MSSLDQWAWMLGSGSISGKSFYGTYPYPIGYAKNDRLREALAPGRRQGSIARVNTYGIGTDPTPPPTPTPARTSDLDARRSANPIDPASTASGREARAKVRPSFGE
jgi:hypothetical protein